MKNPICPLCGVRRARRACPALDAPICGVCCGTKRVVEIRCPETCVYLAGARVHPPVVVQRQHQRDAQRIAELLRGLSESQFRLLALLQSSLHRHSATALPPLLDADVADGVSALAATLETTDRGVIYEHYPSSVPAQRLWTELKRVLDELRQSGGPRLDRDAAAALRRIEAAARQADGAGGGRTAYLDFVARLTRQAAGKEEKLEASAAIDQDRSRLIIP